MMRMNLALHLSACFYFCIGKEILLLEDPVVKYLLPKPNLKNGSSTVLECNKGDTVFLPCRFDPEIRSQDVVNNQEEKQGAVSWIRRRDWSILSAGVFSNTQDDRFAVLHREGTDDYTLQIKYVQRNDTGTYECQVPTGAGFLSHFVDLRVVQHRAIIIGTRELHVSTGDAFALTCVVEKILTPPVFVMWLHMGIPLNYAPDKPRINVQINPNGTLTTSTITVVDVRSMDSGNYSCVAPNAISDSVMVYVTGDEVAAVQRIKPMDSAAPQQQQPFLHFSLFHSSFFILVLKYSFEMINTFFTLL